jgi:hypothetical protein
MFRLRFAGKVQIARRDRRGERRVGAGSALTTLVTMATEQYFCNFANVL